MSTKKTKKGKAMETQAVAQEQAVVQEPASTVDVQPVVEQPGPVEEKKPRVNKRPYIEDVRTWLEVGSHSRKEIMEQVLAKFPQVSKGGITTFVTDLKNVKYSHFKERQVIERDGKLIFADAVVSKGEEAGLVPVAEEPEATTEPPADNE